MHNEAFDSYAHADCYKTHKMCDKSVNTDSSTIHLFLNAIELKKCVIKLLIVFLYLILFLIYIKLKKCDRAIYDPFMPFYYPDRYETQKCIMKLLIFFRSIKIYS